MTRRPPSFRWTTLAVLGGALAVAQPAHAQMGGPGFAFKAPRATLSLRGGLAGATAGGDLFAFTTDVLTLDRADFRGLAFGGDLAFGRPGARLALLLSAGYAWSSAPSDFRDWLDDDGQPIVQTTTFARVPLSVGARAYLTSPGRTIGRFAWIPARVAPYVGAGVGMTWYRFRQEGDWVDFDVPEGEPPPIFNETFEASGWGPSGWAGGGIDFTLTPWIALNADARYSYGRANVGGSYEGFDRIDLSGFATTVGFTFRF